MTLRSLLWNALLTSLLHHLCIHLSINTGFWWKTPYLFMWLLVAALYFTVPMAWFLMEHHALNTSLKNKKYQVSKMFSNICWKQTLYQCMIQNPTHLQWVATHSLLQYSLSQSSLSTAGLLQPALTHTLFMAVALVDPFTSISSWKKGGKNGKKIVNIGAWIFPYADLKLSQ